MRVLVGTAALVLFLILSATSAWAARQIGGVQPYMLPNTETRQIQSATNGAIYQLMISAPADYQTSGKRYPVVFMLDADYSFALTRNVVQHLVDRKKLPPMILVAIGYPGTTDDLEAYAGNRKRDYTPSAKPSADGTTNGQGGADQFKTFIATELIPYVEANFPVTADRTFIGHSYGGLFGTYVMLTDASLFKRYVIVSPSLWYDNELIFGLEKKAPAGPIQAHAFFAIGSLETRAETGAPMVQELKQFYNRLATRRGGGFSLSMHVFEGETHNSVFPGAVTRGLLSVFAGVQAS